MKNVLSAKVRKVLFARYDKLLKSLEAADKPRRFSVVGNRHASKWPALSVLIIGSGDNLRCFNIGAADGSVRVCGQVSNIKCQSLLLLSVVKHSQMQSK